MAFTHLRLGNNIRFQWTHWDTDVVEERKGRFEGLDYGKPIGEWGDAIDDQWWMTIFDYDRMAPRTFPLGRILPDTLVIS